jgi:NAD(P)-dependent dehydrogenase (short-subunit alcohol dehydrogenase family)
MILDGDKWTVEDMPDMTGETVVVTGANSGLGFEAAKGFARKNAEVVMACRNTERAQDAKEDIETEVEDARLEVIQLDLASLESVDEFVEEFKQEHSRLDVLCNNAGVMAIPYSETEDGFEKQIGVNHLGHFALTAGLTDTLQETENSRIVLQSSGLHRNADLEVENLMQERSYDKWRQYANSKLANLLFSYELDRRLEDDTSALACHPGYADTHLQIVGPEKEGSRAKKIGAKITNKIVAQSASMGALPMMYAATSEDVESGDFIGPAGIMQMRGYPEKQESSEASHDRDLAKRLWERSEELTGKEFNL